ncbi:COX15/CtaA family protein [Methylobacterium sp. 77]|uniref:COX15/CtaA family protein n=1 Tax=Methylobacterium sp. 77 TaxID=1101192 RepID=UPI000372976A|nr:COX15/CtaA family protein [Methylobacterium sp. 77]
MPSRDIITTAPSRSKRPVRIWLYTLAVLVVAMVAVGGATRLTGSGLSITEWRPVTGVVPPVSEQAWAAEFDKYKDTPQYRILNQGMGLSDFKVIYAWEWSHRLLGRVLGLAFFVPLLVFWRRGLIDRRLGYGLLGLGALGGLQGTIGWIMVASGLQPGMTAVAPLKLALHLTTASLILAGLVWLAAGLRAGSSEPAPGRLRLTAGLLPILVLLQIALGGLVAGSKAGLVHNTWPDMDGVLVPGASELFAVSPWIENFVDNVTLVQFNHRLMAYCLIAFALFHAIDARRQLPASGTARRAAGIAGLTLAQAGLGIVTLLLAVPLWAGLAHQVFAMAVLMMATVHARLSRGTPLQTESSHTAVTAAFGFEGLTGRSA